METSKSALSVQSHRKITLWLVSVASAAIIITAITLLPYNVLVMVAVALFAIACTKVPSSVKAAFVSGSVFGTPQAEQPEVLEVDDADGSWSEAHSVHGEATAKHQPKLRDMFEAESDEFFADLYAYLQSQPPAAEK